MKTILFSFCCALSFLGNTQNSSGGGTFPEYKRLEIIKIEEYHYRFSKSKFDDSIPTRTLFFNSKGQMVKEQFNQRVISPYYTYSYNDEGFLVDIDTNGMFVYGHSSSEQLIDTIFSKYSIEETWFSIDTISRLSTSIKLYHTDSFYVKSEFRYDSIGRLTEELIFIKESPKNYILSFSTRNEYNSMGLLSKVIRKDEENNHITEIEEYRFFTTK